LDPLQSVLAKWAAAAAIETGVSSKLKMSATLKSMLQNLEEKDAAKLADLSFEFPGDKPIEIFEKGLQLGRAAKQQYVTWAAVGTQRFYFFIGNESEVTVKVRNTIKENEDPST